MANTGGGQYKDERGGRSLRGSGGCGLRSTGAGAPESCKQTIAMQTEALDIFGRMQRPVASLKGLNTPLDGKA